MGQVIGSGDLPMDGSVERLTNELGEIARTTAQLLLTARYDEAELAELDVRARELRAAIRKALVPEDEGCAAVRWAARSGPLVSGG